MKFLKLLLALLILTPLSVSYAQETGAKPEPNVKIRMLAEKGQIKPGEEIWIGIEQSIRPKWHTYWKNPGDSGARPNIEWTLPEGFTMSEIYWPTPKKIPYAPLLNYGYENNVILLQKLKAPDKIPSGALTLKAGVDILVCEKECIPEYGEYTLTLNGLDAQSENNESYLNIARTKLPQKVAWNSTYKETDNNFKITITPGNTKIFENLNLETVEIFPAAWGLIANPEKPIVTIENDNIVITQKRGDRPMSEVPQGKFVLALGKGESRLSYEITSKLNQPLLAKIIKEDITAAMPEPLNASAGVSLFQALVFALIGGLILNLMPCVFPVLSLKALSLVKIADKNPAAAKIHGLTYTAGVILSFLTIASVLLALKSAGAEIGWGFQLQNPLVIGALTYLLFVIGLNLFGFFEFGAGLTNIGSKLTGGSGYTNSFFTGVLATIVATPCTAPFMAAALGFALTQPAIISLIIFASLGLGLALPYLILSFSPKLEKMLPKPGAWMDTFKQALAFPMFLSAAWLTWVLGEQAGLGGMLAILIGAILIIFAIWIGKKLNNQTGKAITILTILLAILLIPTTPKTSETINAQNSMIENEESWTQPWSPDALETALAGSNPVFVEMTAAWCITCKVNHATSINIDSTKGIFAENNVTYLLGDWTNRDAKITKYLNSYGRNGVPIYVYYKRPDENGVRPEPEILPQILTPGTIADLFQHN